MKSRRKLIVGLLIVIVTLASAFGLYLNRPLAIEPQPATFTCLDESDGKLVPFEPQPANIYGVGLSFAKHINETASEFDPSADPPIFRKALHSLTRHDADVAIPSVSDIQQAVEQLEPGITKQLQDYKDMPVLLDYETELGFVLLEDVSSEDLKEPDFAPPIGFFVGNDLSARCLAVLGEGRTNRYEYWGVSKSFPGFLPVSEQIWVPQEYREDAIPCVRLKTLVNDEVRQSQMTSDMIYTPLQMLQAIHRKYPDTALKKNDLILMGTPGGVALSTPRWLMRLAGIVGLDRFSKLDAAIGKADNGRFLKSGDHVRVSGEWLGSVGVTLSN